MLSTALVATWKRRVWCADLGREVEVEFEERGLPGLRWKTRVRSCSAFDPATDVTCRRRCIDPQYRRRWTPPMYSHAPGD